MRFIATGVKDGKSCVIEEIDCTLEGEEAGIETLLELPVAALPPRPDTRARHHELALPAGRMRWLRVRFAPHRTVSSHYTDSIDCFTVISGSLELVLDDGPHRLLPGDCGIVRGLDHGWRTGEEPCVISTLLFGTPPR